MARNLGREIATMTDAERGGKPGVGQEIDE